MSKELNLEVIAEGIETQEQVDFLARFACADLQGFLFGKPVVPEQIPDLIRKQLNITNTPNS